MLAALFGIYEFHARRGVPLARALVDSARSGRGDYKPFLHAFLHGISRTRGRGRVGRLRERERLPSTLDLEQVAAVIAARERLRNRFLFALLFGTGIPVHREQLDRTRALIADAKATGRQ